MSASRSHPPGHLLFITHAEVRIDPAIPIDRWALSEAGRARHTCFNDHPAAARIGVVYASTEQKAQDGAAILAHARALSVRTCRDLGENDRTATGYLPSPEFERTADAFFAQPTRSIRGWERAIDAQHRIATAVASILYGDDTGVDIAIVAHGGVGALLLASMLQQPISRSFDQPGQGGGNFFVVDKATRAVVASWRPIA